MTVWIFLRSFFMPLWEHTHSHGDKHINLKTDIQRLIRQCDAVCLTLQRTQKKIQHMYKPSRTAFLQVCWCFSKAALLLWALVPNTFPIMLGVPAPRCKRHLLQHHIPQAAMEREIQECNPAATEQCRQPGHKPYTLLPPSTDNRKAPKEAARMIQGNQATENGQLKINPGWIHRQNVFTCRLSVAKDWWVFHTRHIAPEAGKTAKRSEGLTVLEGKDQTCSLCYSPFAGLRTMR